MSEKSEPWYVREQGDAFSLAEMAAHAALIRKAEDILVLDLRGRSDVADFFVLGTGLSDTQVESIGRAVIDDLLDAGHKAMHTEGFGKANWLLLDYVDVVVHVMQPRAREYYRLERLWSDAGHCRIDPDYFRRPAVVDRHPDLSLIRRGAAATGTSEGEEGP